MRELGELCPQSAFIWAAQTKNRPSILIRISRSNNMQNLGAFLKHSLLRTVRDGKSLDFFLVQQRQGAKIMEWEEVGEVEEYCWPLCQIDLFVQIDISVKIDIFVQIDLSVKLSPFQLLISLSITFDIFINIWELRQLLIFSSTIWLRYQLVVPVNCNFAPYS